MTPIIWTVLLAIAIVGVEVVAELQYRRLPSIRRRLVEYLLSSEAAPHDSAEQRETQASPIRYAEHPFLAFSLSPDFVNSRGERIHNRFGFRASQDWGPRTAGTLRIYLAGGSTVYDAGVESNEETFAMLLERQLVSRLCRPVEVINGGVGNYTSWQSFIRLAAWIDYLDPQVVVTYQGINDITAFLYTDATSASIVPDYQHCFRSLNLSDLKRRVPLWVRYSRLGRFWYTQRLDHRNLNIRFLTMKGPDKVHHIGKDVDFAVSYIGARIRYDIIETHLRNTAAICASRGIGIVMLTERLERGSDEWYRPFLEEVNDRIRKLGASGICSVIDFDRTFPSDSTDFAGSMHFSLKGNVARAEWIAQALIPHLVSLNS